MKDKWEQLIVFTGIAYMQVRSIMYKQKLNSRQKEQINQTLGYRTSHDTYSFSFTIREEDLVVKEQHGIFWIEWNGINLVHELPPDVSKRLIDEYLEEELF